MKNETAILDARVDSLEAMVETAENSLDGILELSDVDFSSWQPFEDCQKDSQKVRPTDEQKP